MNYTYGEPYNKKIAFYLLKRYQDNRTKILDLFDIDQFSRDEIQDAVEAFADAKLNFYMYLCLWRNNEVKSKTKKQRASGEIGKRAVLKNL